MKNRLFAFLACVVAVGLGENVRAQSSPDGVTESAYRYGNDDRAVGLSLGIAVPTEILRSGSQIPIYVCLKNDEDARSRDFKQSKIVLRITDSSGKEVHFKRGLLTLYTMSSPTYLDPSRTYVRIVPLIAGPPGTYSVEATEELYDSNHTAVLAKLVSGTTSLTVTGSGS